MDLYRVLRNAENLFHSNKNILGAATPPKNIISKRSSYRRFD